MKKQCDSLIINEIWKLEFNPDYIYWALWLHEFLLQNFSKIIHLLLIIRTVH